MTPDGRKHFRDKCLPTAYLSLLVGLNVYISRDLFRVEYTGRMQTVEGSFVAITRVLSQHPLQMQSSWWPFWNGGMPFQFTYLPLFHWTAALFSKLAGQSPALAVHSASAFFYCLGPLTLFLMCWGLSERPGLSFLAALAYSLLSPSAILVPAIRNDVGGMWNPRRLHNLVHWGEDPHVAALAILPLAVLFLHFSIRRRRPLWYILAGISMGAVALTNAFGVSVLALAVAALLFAEDFGLFWKNLALTVVIGLLAHLFVSPWLPPSLIRSILFNSPTAGGDFSLARLSRLSMGMALAAFLLLWVFLRRTKPGIALRFSALFAALVCPITLLAYAANIYILPQPLRYQLELDLAICLLAAFLGAAAVDRLPAWARIAAVTVLLLLAVPQTIHCRRFARRLIQPVDVTRTPEYKTAMWLDHNLKGQRVMASGSSSFWLNAFTDEPQLSGGHDPTAPNWSQRVAVFIIYTGMNAGPRAGEVATIWMKAFGVQALTVSSEFWKTFTDPNKFEGLLPVLWREGSETVYRVPQRSPSLAHVLPAGATVSRTPLHGLDIEQVASYVAALNDPSLPLAGMRWLDLNSARIETTLYPGQVLSVQVTYHPGWRARINGVAQPVSRDGLGLLVVKPDCRGPCQIDLSYDGGSELIATWLVSGLVAAAVIFWFGRGARRTKRRADC